MHPAHHLTVRLVPLDGKLVAKNNNNLILLHLFRFLDKFYFINNNESCNNETIK